MRSSAKRPDVADVVVVGAGIVGACVAYVLARDGLDVCIVEKEGIGSGSTGHGHGVISLVGKDFKPGPHFALGVAGGHMYGAFAAAVQDDSGIDPLYHELEGISLALVDEEEQIFREFMEREETRTRVDMRWIGVDEARELEPRLTTEAIGGVLYRHGQVDGYRLTLAAVEATERLGGRVLLREATGLRLDGTRAVGVSHAHGTIACDQVVIAAGAWAGAMSDLVGWPIPVRPLHGEVLHVRLPGDPVHLFVLTARHGPILPRRDGILMVGSIGGVSMSGLDVDTKHVFNPEEPAVWEFDGQPKEQSRDFMIERALRVMPSIEEAELVAHLAGCRPLCADRLPLIGTVPGLDNVYLATGHGTKGIHLAPITARIIADFLFERKPELDGLVAAFAPGRFASRAGDPARGAVRRA